MALYFDVKVNGITIGSLYAKRREAINDLGPDRMATYEVELHDHQNGTSRRGEIRHSYNHGSWSLIRTIIDELVTVPPEDWS